MEELSDRVREAQDVVDAGGDSSVSPSVGTVSLYPHQLEGVRWILSRVENVSGERRGQGTEVEG